jgi:molybdate transport system permease protein
MFGAAGLAAAISVGIGLWLAWLLSNRRFPGQRALGALAAAAVALPSPVICYYLLAVIGHLWSVKRAGLVGAGVLSAAPLLIRAGRGAFASLDPAWAKAARSTGASEWRVFSLVELPLAFRPILAAAVLGFARVLAELAAAFWIADFRP